MQKLCSGIKAEQKSEFHININQMIEPNISVIKKKEKNKTNL